uniref:Uncharacterized protein n=1 Tax=Cacopsylla melanoneura TaxID=428564 RepID=A0A8D8ZQ16_9HEMI
MGVGDLKTRIFYFDKNKNFHRKRKNHPICKLRPSLDMNYIPLSPSQIQIYIIYNFITAFSPHILCLPLVLYFPLSVFSLFLALVSFISNTFSFCVHVLWGICILLSDKNVGTIEKGRREGHKTKQSPGGSST